MKLTCKNCGRPLVIIEGVNSCECEYCGTLHTIPNNSDEQKKNAYERAELLQQYGNFSDAKAILNDIAINYPPDYAVYWNLAMCTYGIEYVDDRKTGKRIPTCHRTLIKSIFENEDFKKAYELADIVTKDRLMAEAKSIDIIQKEILKIAANDNPYDVFICYKETDEETGRRTYDSSDAQNIYTQLTKDGYNVFFAPVSLSECFGSEEYEPHIYAALNSAKVMVMIASKNEYLDAPWVKNEWSRFIEMAETDKSKLFIGCYRKFLPSNFEKHFGKIQFYDIDNSASFYRNILAKIEKYVEKDDNKNIQSGVSTQNLLERAKMFIDDRDFDNANKYCEQVLDIDAKNSLAYFYKMLSSRKITEPELNAYEDIIENDGDFVKALRFANAEYKAVLNSYNSKVNENYRIRQEQINEENRLKREKNLKLTLEQAEEALYNGEYQKAKTYYGYAVEEKPEQESFFNLFLACRQCSDASELIEQGIPVDNDANFDKAYEIATPEYRAFLDNIKMLLLNTCHLKFMGYAEKNNVFYMKQWASHYEKSGDKELSDLHKFIISIGGLSVTESSVPGAYLKLSEICERLSKDNPDYADGYNVEAKLSSENFIKNMKVIELLIPQKRVLPKLNANENFVAAKSAGEINNAAKQAFSVKDSNLSVNKTGSAPNYPNTETFSVFVNSFKNILNRYSIELTSHEEVVQLKERFEKQLSSINDQNFNIQNFFDKFIAASGNELFELIDIWVNPKESFIKKSGMKLGDISFDDGYSSVPAERYIVIGEKLLKLGLDDSNISLARACFDKALNLGGKEYKKAVEAAIEKVIDRNSQSMAQIAGYIKLSPDDAELKWQYVKAYTKNFTLFGDDYSKDEEYDKYLNNKNYYSSITSPEADKILKHLNLKLENAEAYPKNVINNLDAYVKFVFDNAGENKKKYQKEWESYLNALEDYRIAANGAINNRIAIATGNRTNALKQAKTKFIIKRTVKAVLSTLIILLAAIPVGFIIYYQNNPLEILKHKFIWYFLAFIFGTVLMGFIQDKLSKISFIRTQVTNNYTSYKGVKRSDLVTKLSIVTSALALVFVIYSLVTFSGNFKVVSIKTPEELEYVANYAYANYKLEADIDMEKYPDFCIGSIDKTFDGQGHTISNIKLTEDAFIETNDGTVKNLKIKDIEVGTEAHFMEENEGVLENVVFIEPVLKNSLILENTKTIKEVTVLKATMNITKPSDETSALAILVTENTGSISKSNIKVATLSGQFAETKDISDGYTKKNDCAEFGTIAATGDGTITECDVIKLTTKAFSAHRFYGIGFAKSITSSDFTKANINLYSEGFISGIGTGVITNCTSSGKIKVWSCQEPAYGGISAEAETIKHCVSSLATKLTLITHDDEGFNAPTINIGGLAGILEKKVEESKFAGTLKVVYKDGGYTRYLYVGGLVGCANGPDTKILNSYTSGRIDVELKPKDFPNFTSGIFGCNYWNNAKVTIENCYVSGTIAISGDIGDVGGISSGNLETYNCFFTGKFEFPLDSTSRFWITGQQSGNYYSSTCGYQTSYSGYFEQSESVKPAKFRNVDFIKNTLGWDENIWNIKSGKLPTLKSYTEKATK